jgi:asparagine synthase (glutamine-hydrolysing)
MLAEHMAGLRRVIPDTLYQDVSHLLGGHALVARGSGEVRLQRYWDPSPDRELCLGSDAEYLEAFRHELDAAVRRSLTRMPGKVGLLLSGGLDSTAVAVVAGKQLAAQGRRLQAIHRVPRPGSRYRAPLRELDESHYVELFRHDAPYIDFHFLENAPPAASPEEWEQFFADNFVPFDTFPLTADPQWSDAVASLGISALLDGIGGNLLVSLEAQPSGYLEHLAVSAHWPAWWRELRGHHRVYGRSLRDLIRETTVNPLRRWWRGPAAFTPAANRQLMLLHPALRRRTEIEPRWQQDKMEWNQPPRNFRQRLHRVFTEVTAQQIGVTPSVITRERITMLGGSPLFDRRLNEFCLALPFEQQIRHGWDRRLLRESLRDDVPGDVRLRVTRGFPQPEFQALFAQMQPPLGAALERIRASSVATELLDYDRLRTLWQERSGNTSLENDLALVRGVTLGMFLLWHEQRGSL